LPDDAALLRIEVAEVVLKSTVTVLPLIVVGDTKFGAAMFYPQIIAGMIPPPLATGSAPGEEFTTSHLAPEGIVTAYPEAIVTGPTDIPLYPAVSV
jgi:hypothetical protein